MFAVVCFSAVYSCHAYATSMTSIRLSVSASAALNFLFPDVICRLGVICY